MYAWNKIASIKDNMVYNIRKFGTGWDRNRTGQNGAVQYPIVFHRIS
jgi:hypothetical protein